MIISSLKNVTQHEQIKKLKQKRKIPDRNNYRIHPLNKKGQCRTLPSSIIMNILS